MLGGWSSSPAQFCRLLLIRRQTEHLLTPEHFDFRFPQKQNQSLQIGGRSARTSLVQKRVLWQLKEAEFLDESTGDF